MEEKNDSERTEKQTTDSVDQRLSQMLAAALQRQTFDSGNIPEDILEGVYDSARRHAVLSLLAEDFCACPSLRQRAREVCRQTALQSYRLLFLSKYVVETLRECGIETVLLKGISAAQYYRVPELRKSGDVDIQLLDPSQIRRAESWLKQRGFRTSEEQDANHHLSMFSPDGVEVELHVMLVEPFDDGEINRYLEQLIARLRPHIERRDIMGVELPVLSDGLQAFQLLLHMLQHFLRSGFGLKLLCDWVVLWNRGVDGEECALYRQLTADTGLEKFSGMITSLCVYYLGLERERAECMCRELFLKEEAAFFWRDILEAEEFGGSDRKRMVVLRDRGLKGYIREFHHQMHLNFPRAGRCFLLFPVLWLITLLRFLRNNRKIRRVSLGQVLKTADNRSCQIERLELFKK